MLARKKRSESALKRWAKDKKNCSPKSTNRPAKRKQWSDESMLQAIEAVRSGMMGTNQAARAHGVPPTTLKDRLAGRVKHGTRPGPPPTLLPRKRMNLHCSWSNLLK